MTRPTNGIALVAGASSGIGAIYADRLARRDYDLILVARNRGRLYAQAHRLAAETGRTIEVLPADLSKKADLRRVETELRGNHRITLLLTCAGRLAATPLLASDIDATEAMTAINVTAVTRLFYAAVPGMVIRGGGTIINIASIAGLTPELLNGVYGATKAVVAALSLSLYRELAEMNVRLQTVLPGATATELWVGSGVLLDRLPAEAAIPAEDTVDAALEGLDRGEVVTIPSLPDVADWQGYEAALRKLIPSLPLKDPGIRYRDDVAA